MAIRLSALLAACAVPASAQPGSVIPIDGRDWSPARQERPAPPRPERRFPPPEPYFARERAYGTRWAGPYVGVNAGAALHSFHADDADFYYSFDRYTLQSVGGVGGVKLGWNLVRGSILLGLEGEFDWDVAARTAHKVRNDAVEYAGDMSSFAALRARAGALVADQVLVFGTAGPVYARYEQSFGGRQAGQLWRWEGWRWGVMAGGGLEFALSERLTLSTEFLRAAFMPRLTFPQCVPAANGACNADSLAHRYKFAPELDLLRAGVSVHF